MRVLLTGASGFLGRHVLPRLAGEHEVISIQRRTPEVGLPGVRYIIADLVGIDPTDLPDQIDAVVHLAAHLDNPFGVEPPLSELAPTNVLGTLYLLEAVAERGIRRFVYGSTGGVAGAGMPGTTIRETSPPQPENGYGLTKHLAEQALLAYLWPFDVVSLRYYYPYGRDGSNPMFRYLAERLVAGDEIEVGADEGPVMNPLHVDDAAELTIRALDAPKLPGVINVAGPDRTTKGEVVRLLASALRCVPRLRTAPDPAPSHLADISLLERSLGRPRIGVAEGIPREFGRVR